MTFNRSRFNAPDPPPFPALDALNGWLGFKGWLQKQFQALQRAVPWAPHADTRDFVTVAEGADASSQFANAVTAVGTGTLFVAPRTYRFFSNVTIPAACLLVFASGATLQPQSGVTVTIVGPVTAGAWFWIDKSAGGNVLFTGNRSIPRFIPQWWGVQGTGTVDEQPALTRMVASLPAYARVHFALSMQIRLDSTWTVYNKDGLVFESDAWPLNATTTDAPTIIWNGAAHGTMVMHDRTRFCGMAGFLWKPNGADICLDLDMVTVGGGIGTECLYTRNFFHNQTANPAWWGIRISNVSGSNEEYHRFIRNVFLGSNEGAVKVCGRDNASGLLATTSGSATVTLSPAFLGALSGVLVWDNTVNNRRIHIKAVGTAGADLDTTITYLNATQGTLGTNALATLAATPFSIAWNIGNPNTVDGFDTVAGSQTITLNADLVTRLGGTWSAALNGKRFRINCGGTTLIATFTPNSVGSTSVVKTAAGWTGNQWQGKILAVVAGTGAGQWVFITDNSSDTINWAEPLPVALDGTSQVKVFDSLQLDTTITYASATTGTLGVAAGLTLAGAYAIIDEMTGGGILISASFNAKRQISDGNTFLSLAVGIREFGGSLHSYDDNFSDCEVAYDTGGALSEPIIISGGNCESCRKFMQHNATVGIHWSDTRMAGDRINPGGGYNTFGASASTLLMGNNSYDGSVTPFGSTFFNGVGSAVRVKGYGPNQWGYFTADQMGYASFSPNQSQGGWTWEEGTSDNDQSWGIRQLQNSRTPGSERFRIANRLDGRNIFGLPESAPLDRIIPSGASSRWLDASIRRIRERTRLADKSYIEATYPVDTSFRSVTGDPGSASLTHDGRIQLVDPNSGDQTYDISSTGAGAMPANWTTTLVSVGTGRVAIYPGATNTLSGLSGTNGTIWLTYRGQVATLVSRGSGVYECIYRYNPARVPDVRGDVNVTLSGYAATPEQRYQTPLTVARDCQAVNANAGVGDEFLIIREAAATGAFNLNVKRDDGTTLKALTVSQWCRIKFDGTNWYLASFGAL